MGGAPLRVRASVTVAVVHADHGQLQLTTAAAPAVVLVMPWRPTLAELVDIAADNGARQLWVHRSALELLDLRTELPDQRRPDEARQWEAAVAELAWFLEPGWGWAPNDPTPALWRTWFRERDGTAVAVSVPAWAPRGTPSPFARCPGGAELLGAVERFQVATGSAWWGTGAVTSDRWLRELHRRGTQIQPAQLPEPATGPERGGMAPAWEYPVKWWRTELAAGERSARYCHHFDKTAMYLGAASSLALPAGPFQRFEAAHFPLWPAGKLPPGLWHMRRPAWPYPTLPDPFQPQGRRADHIWVTTPTLQLAAELLPDQPAEVTECYVWDESHRYLEPWYRRIRDALAGLQRGTAERDALKAVYQQGWGRLASRKRGEQSWDLYQPVWAMTLVAEARNRMVRQLARLERPPVAVDVDGAWFLTSIPDPARFASTIGLRLGDGIGQWRHLNTTTGTEARAALQQPTATTVVKALKGQSE